MDIQRFLFQNNPTKFRVDPAAVVVNPISFGDCVVWSPAADRFIKRHVAGSALFFLGVAMGRFPVSSNLDHTTTPNPADANVTVFDRGTFFFNTTAAESYENGDPVKLGADAQTIALATQITDQAAIIGSIVKPEDSAATVGAAGVSVRVNIMRRFPNFVVSVLDAAVSANLPMPIN